MTPFNLLPRRTGVSDATTGPSVLHKHPKTRNFTQLENAMLRDERLSFRATGLLAYLLSLPQGSAIDSTTLSGRKREGRDAIRSAYRELEGCGYVERERTQDPGGTWRTLTHVYEEPPKTGNQASVDRGLGNRTSETQALSLSESKTDEQEEDRQLRHWCGAGPFDLEGYQNHLEGCQAITA